MVHGRSVDVIVKDKQMIVKYTCLLNTFSLFTDLQVRADQRIKSGHRVTPTENESVTAGHCGL